ncbi:MAG: integrase, partial [Candidatus Heimdallarchaeaceae archaeon]
EYVRQMVGYLRRFVREPIRGPMDVVGVFEGLSVGQRHQLIRAVRNLFNFYESQGLASKEWLDLLRMNVPKDEVGLDLWIPSEEEIIDSLKALSKAENCRVYFALFNLILDSGLRISEATKFLNSFKGEVEKQDGFYIASLGYLRKSKTAYYAFFTEYTFKLLNGLDFKLSYKTARNSYKIRKRTGKRIVRLKYLRKFAFDKMISLEVPESVADFIQGRTPKTIGARHYMRLKRKAIQFYPRYTSYLIELRQKAKIT